MSLSKIFKLAVVVLVFALVLPVAVVSAATYVPPQAGVTPPNCPDNTPGCDSPIHTGAAQTKTGALTGLGGFLSSFFRALNPFDTRSNFTLSWFDQNPDPDPAAVDPIARMRIGGDGPGAVNGFVVQGQGDKTLFKISDDGSITAPGTTNTKYVRFLGQAGDSAIESAVNPINGVMYYNINSQKFRCKQAGAWVDCIGGGSSTGGGEWTRKDSVNGGKYLIPTTKTDQIAIGNVNEPIDPSGNGRLVEVVTRDRNDDGLRLSNPISAASRDFGIFLNNTHTSNGGSQWFINSADNASGYRAGLHLGVFGAGVPNISLKESGSVLIGTTTESAARMTVVAPNNMPKAADFVATTDFQSDFIAGGHPGVAVNAVNPGKNGVAVVGQAFNDHRGDAYLNDWPIGGKFIADGAGVFARSNKVGIYASHRGGNLGGVDIGWAIPQYVKNRSSATPLAGFFNGPVEFVNNLGSDLTHGVNIASSSGNGLEAYTNVPGRGAISAYTGNSGVGILSQATGSTPPLDTYGAKLLSNDVGAVVRGNNVGLYATNRGGISDVSTSVSDTDTARIPAGSYAGYFDGPVNITGTTTLQGKVGLGVSEQDILNTMQFLPGVDVVAADVSAGSITAPIGLFFNTQHVPTTAPANPQNGYMYYSSSTNKFKCFEAGAWKDCIGGGSTTGGDTLWGGSLAGNINSLNTGNVGIGTNAPAQKLHVNGPVLSGDYFTSGASQGYWLGQNNLRRYGIYFNDGASGRVAIRSGSDTVDRVSVLDNGDVGIGTDAPTSRFTVAGGRAQFVGNSTPTGGAGLELGYGNNESIVASFDRAAGGTAKQLRFNALNYIFQTNSVDRLVIAPTTGNIGIGTSSPTAKLHVAGNAKIDGTNTVEFGAGVAGKEGNAGKIGYQTFSGNSLDIVGAGPAAGKRVVRIYDNLNVVGTSTFNGTTTFGGPVCYEDGSCSTTNNNSGGSSKWASSTNPANIYAATSGNVGIGTNAPSLAKLDVQVNSGTGIALTSAQNQKTEMRFVKGTAEGYAMGINADTDNNFYISRGSGIGSQNAITVSPTTDAGGTRVGIGTNAPGSKFHVNGSGGSIFTLSDGTQGAGKVLQSNANGGASWVATSTLGIAGGAFWALTPDLYGADGNTVYNTNGGNVRVEGAVASRNSYVDLPNFVSGSGGYYFSDQNRTVAGDGTAEYYGMQLNSDGLSLRSNNRGVFNISRNGNTATVNSLFSVDADVGGANNMNRFAVNLATFNVGGVNYNYDAVKFAADSVPTATGYALAGDNSSTWVNAPQSLFLRAGNQDMFAINNLGAALYGTLAVGNQLKVGNSLNVNSGANDKFVVGATSGDVGMVIANEGTSASDYSAIRFYQGIDADGIQGTKYEKGVIFSNQNQLTIKSASGGSARTPINLDGSVVNVTGNIKITGGSPVAGSVLTATDASGNATWQTPTGVSGGGLWTRVQTGNSFYVTPQTGADSVYAAAGFNGSAISVDGGSRAANFFTNNPNGTGSGAITGLYFGNTSSGASEAIGIRNEGTSLHLRAGGVNRLSVNNAGNIGIGTTSPSNKLTVVGGGIHVSGAQDLLTFAVPAGNGGTRSWVFRGSGGAADTNLDLQSIVPNKTFRIVDSGGSSVADFEASTVSGGDRVRLAPNGGRVGIGGQASPTYPLVVHGGNIHIPNGDVVEGSDVRLKTNITPIKSAVAKVKQLAGVMFNWKSDGRQDVGVIAQDVEKVFPELVSTDEKGMKAVNYSGLVAPLIEAVKEQQTQIESLQAQIDELKASVK